MRADFRTSLNAVSINNLRFGLGKLVVGGEANIDLSGPRPLIKGSIKSGPLVIDNFLTAPENTGQKSSRMPLKGSRVQRRSSSKKAQSRFSKDAIDLSSLKAVDADLTFKAPVLAYGKILVEIKKKNLKIQGIKPT